VRETVNSFCVTLAVFLVISVQFTLFTARRYDSAVYMLSSCVRLSVRRSQAKPVLCGNDWTNRAGFWHGGFLPPIPDCAVRKFGYLQKLEYSRLDFVPNSGLENFATESRSRCQQHSSSSSSSSSTVEFVDDTYTTIDESWLFTTSRSTVTLYIHYCDLLWICCTTCFYG